MSHWAFLPFRYIALVRDMAIRHYTWTTCIYMAFMVFVLYGNYRTSFLRGGLLDDALPAYSIPRQMDDYVKRIPDFNASEFVAVVIKASENAEILSKSDFLFLIQKTKEAKKEFPKSVVSVASIPDYQDDGESLDVTPYVVRRKVLDPSFSPEEFLTNIASKPQVWNLFIGRKWALISIILPSNYDEMAWAWKIIEFVEGRSIPWWERVFKANIEPSDPRIAVSGWVLGRWAINQGLNADMLLLPSIGVVMAFVFLWWWLGTVREALIGVTVCILSGILITRGSIALLNYLGFGVYERVYTLLAPTNVIVQGFVCIHVFEAFREAPKESSLERFLYARHINSAIMFIALLACMAFVSLFVWPIWQMHEMAIVSLVGVTTILIGSTVILPAVYLSVEVILGPEKEYYLRPRAARRQFAGVFVSVLRIPPWVSVAISVPPFIFAVFLFNAGYIETNTSPWEYIKGMLVERTYRFLEENGTGNDTLDFYVEWKGSERYTRHSSMFLENVWRLQNNLRPNGVFEEWQKDNYSSVVAFKNVGSILDNMAVIARESYNKPFPVTDMEADDTFNMLMSDVPRKVQKALWSKYGIRLTAVAVLNSSNEQRAMLERVQLFAKKHYPTLAVRPFGKNSLYPSVDAYITGGQNQNVGITMFSMFLLYVGWIFVYGRTYLFPIAGAVIFLIPFVFSIGVMGCFMTVAGIPLSMSTAPIFDLAVNAAADFSVYLAAKLFFELRLGKDPYTALESALHLEGAVVFMDFILNVIAFTPLLVSRFEPVRELGWMMVLMLMCCGVGVLVLVPSLLKVFVKNSNNIDMEVSRD